MRKRGGEKDHIRYPWMMGEKRKLKRLRGAISEHVR